MSQETYHPPQNTNVSREDESPTWKRALAPLRTPAVIGPECSPTLIANFCVSSPNLGVSSASTSVLNLRKHSEANLLIIIAWSGCGSGNPVAAEVRGRRKCETTDARKG